MRNLPPPGTRSSVSVLFLALLMAAVTIAPAARAGVVLAVDFDSFSSVDDTETGFNKWNVGFNDFNGPSSMVFGAYTATIAADITVDGSGNINGTGAMLGRERTSPNVDAGSFTYDDLYRDLLLGKTGVISLEVAGLDLNTAYNVTVFAYDDSGSGSTTFTNRTGGASATLGTISWTAATVFDSSTPNNIYALTSSVTSDSSGRIIISSVGPSNGPGRINGFIIESVPEPSAALLLGFLGLTGLAVRRRRILD